MKEQEVDILLNLSDEFYAAVKDAPLLILSFFSSIKILNYAIGTEVSIPPLKYIIIKFDNFSVYVWGDLLNIPIPEAYWSLMTMTIIIIFSIFRGYRLMRYPSFFALMMAPSRSESFVNRPWRFLNPFIIMLATYVLYVLVYVVGISGDATQPPLDEAVHRNFVVSVWMSIFTGVVGCQLYFLLYLATLLHPKSIATPIFKWGNRALGAIVVVYLTYALGSTLLDFFPRDRQSVIGLLTLLVVLTGLIQPRSLFGIFWAVILTLWADFFYKSFLPEGLPMPPW